jgi:hypothetical protein
MAAVAVQYYARPRENWYHVYSPVYRFDPSGTRLNVKRIFVKFIRVCSFTVDLRWVPNSEKHMTTGSINHRTADTKECSYIYWAWQTQGNKLLLLSPGLWPYETIPRSCQANMVPRDVASAVARYHHARLNHQRIFVRVIRVWSIRLVDHRWAPYWEINRTTGNINHRTVDNEIVVVPPPGPSGTNC